MKTSHRGACVALIFASSLVLSASIARAEPKAPPPPGAAAKADEEDDTPAVRKPKPNPAEAKYWQAVKLFQNKGEDPRAARALLEEAVAGEFTPAQLLLGECYATGSHGYSKSPRRAANYLRLAAERGNGFAEVSYAICLNTGFGVWKNRDKAFEWATAALSDKADYSRPTPPPDFFEKKHDAQAEAESVADTADTDPVDSAKARAHFVLAEICERRKQAAESQAHLVAAANAGPAGRSGLQQAAVLAAVNFAFGRGVPRDLKRANEMLDQSRKLVRHAGISLVHQFAAEKVIDDFAVSDVEEATAKASDELAGTLQLAFAWDFVDRKSKDYNPQEAVKWFELAAESNEVWAMLELGLLYSGNELGAPQPEKAFAWFEKVGGGDVPKHNLGVADLVICYHEGFGTKKDVAKAEAIAKKHRNQDIVCYLATIGQCPKAIVTFEQDLELNELWAKKKKDPQAECILGQRYMRGWGVETDVKTAVRWFERAIKAGNVPACDLLGDVYTERWYQLGYDDPDRPLAKAVEYYRKGSELGDAQATSDLGYAYDSGRGVPVDKKKAEEYYLKALAIDPKLPAAVNNLGTIYEERWKTALKDKDAHAIESNRKSMLSYYEKAEPLDPQHAAYNLGCLYYDGKIGEKDYQKAYGYFEEAAEHGSTEARFRLGEMHEKGEGVPVTYTEAAYHYRLAALDGHIKALQRLVQFYLEGKGGAQDFDRAMFWLTQLFRHGQFGAIAVAADVALRQGKYDEAVDILEYLRDLDDRKLSGFAYERLSMCYEAGLGVRKRPSKAKSYLKKAFELGNPDAIYYTAREEMAAGKIADALALFEKASGECTLAAYALGQMSYFGQNMPKNVPKAVEYLRTAAKGGNSDADYFLAGLTYNHVAGAPSLDEAIQYAAAAEALGNSKAATLRDKLEQRRLKEADKPQTTTGAHST